MPTRTPYLLRAARAFRLQRRQHPWSDVSERHLGCVRGRRGRGLSRALGGLEWKADRSPCVCGTARRGTPHGGEGEDARGTWKAQLPGPGGPRKTAAGDTVAAAAA